MVSPPFPVSNGGFSCYDEIAFPVTGPLTCFDLFGPMDDAQFIRQETLARQRRASVAARRLLLVQGFDHCLL